MTKSHVAVTRKFSDQVPGVMILMGILDCTSPTYTIFWEI